MSTAAQDVTVYRVLRIATNKLSGWLSSETDDRAQALGWQATYGGHIQSRLAAGWTDEFSGLAAGSAGLPSSS